MPHMKQVGENIQRRTAQQWDNGLGTGFSHASIQVQGDVALSIVISKTAPVLGQFEGWTRAGKTAWIEWLLEVLVTLLISQNAIVLDDVVIEQSVQRFVLSIRPSSNCSKNLEKVESWPGYPQTSKDDAGCHQMAPPVSTAGPAPAVARS